MDFVKRRNKDIVSSSRSTGDEPRSSTRSTGDGLGSSTLNDILGSETSSSEFSPLLARREINNYFLYGGNPNIGDSTKFLNLNNKSSVQGEPEPPISEIEKVSLGSEDADPSISSIRDLEPRRRRRDNTSSASEHSSRIKITRNKKTGKYNIKVKYNKDK